MEKPGYLSFLRWFQKFYRDLRRRIKKELIFQTFGNFWKLWVVLWNNFGEWVDVNFILKIGIAEEYTSNGANPFYLKGPGRLVGHQQHPIFQKIKFKSTTAELPG